MLRPTQDKELINQIAEYFWVRYYSDCSAFDMDKPYGEAKPIKKEHCLEFAKGITEILDKKGYHVGLPESIEYALNCGDGTYRP